MMLNLSNCLTNFIIKKKERYPHAFRLTFNPTVNSMCDVYLSYIVVKCIRTNLITNTQMIKDV